jgi:hypothetical protein
MAHYRDRMPVGRLWSPATGVGGGKPGVSALNLALRKGAICAAQTGLLKGPPEDPDTTALGEVLNILFSTAYRRNWCD